MLNRNMNLVLFVSVVLWMLGFAVFGRGQLMDNYKAAQEQSAFVQQDLSAKTFSDFAKKKEKSVETIQDFLGTK